MTEMRENTGKGKNIVWLDSTQEERIGQGKRMPADFPMEGIQWFRKG